MIIPKAASARLDFYQEVIQQCLVSRDDRIARYAMFRNYFLYGMSEGEKQSAWNNVFANIDLLTSFLYAADTTKFSWKLGTGAPKEEMKRAGPAAKRMAEKWKQSNTDTIFEQSLTWSLVYDSTFLKFIRRGNSVDPYYVDPGCFGVYREDVPMLDRQEAFVHVYYILPAELERRLKYHPHRERLLREIAGSKEKKDTPSETPGLLERVTMNAVSPDLMGQANIDLDVLPDYKANLGVDVIEMGELWVWDDDMDDYQVVTMAEAEFAVYDRRNFFMPKSDLWDAEHCFVQICPTGLPDYFWGQSEVARLVPIQNRLNERMTEIEKLLQKQVDPPGAWSGDGLTEEKLDALNYPGSQVSLGGDPTAKHFEFKPDIPNDVYRDVEKIEQQFLLATGLTNVLMGRGESGVRSSGHANKLANLGSSRPKKRALAIEESLERAATLMARCAFLDDPKPIVDEQENKFVLSQMSTDFTVEVDGHSNSPVFMDNQRENALILFKARAINRRRLIEMLAPPQTDQLVRELDTQIIPEEKAAEQAKNQAIAAGEAKKDGGQLRAVK